MRMRMAISSLLCAVAVLSSSRSDAQSKPVVASVTPSKLAPCDTAGVLAHAQPVFNVGQSRLNEACPAFDRVLADFGTLNPEFAAVIARIRHGVPPAPAKDTTIAPPQKDTTPIPPPPVVVDSTPKPMPDTATFFLADSTWQRCSNAGAVCLFDGTREVRLTNGTQAIVDTATSQKPCAVYGFENRNPGGALHCDTRGPIMKTIVVPVVMGPIISPTIAVFVGSTGSATQDVTNGGGNGVSTDGSGSFRTTCPLTKMAFDDPVVFPGQPGKSHLHMFFGNVYISAASNAANIRQSPSTCRGGTANATGYWTPAMVNALGRIQQTKDAVIYYKTGYNMRPDSTHVMPVGLVMIAGDKNATAAQYGLDLSNPAKPTPGPQQIITWLCLNGSASSKGNATIPACASGDTVRLTVIFPQCWNGKDLDSPDHKSHMSYPTYSSSGRYTSHCPKGFDVQLPELTEHFDFPVAKGDLPATWRLSSDMYDAKLGGGLSAHADWMMGWAPEIMQALVTNCLQKALDCGVGGIGGNRSLF